MLSYKNGNFFIINHGGLHMKKFTITLTAEEREELKQITYKGTYKSQKVINALILLNCDEGEHQKQKTTVM